MRTMLYALFLLAFLPLSIQAQNEHLDRKSTESTLRAEAESLLTEWMDTFLTYQSQDPRPAFNGAVFCPGCMRVHGRIGDAVLPLMYLADRTKDNKYLYAAKRLMAWMENIHCPDGGWMNDVNVSDWNGTTVFAAIALYEALHYHGHLLDDSTRNHWKQQLLEAGEFIMNHPFIYSRNRKGMRNNNVNYSASATYALQAIGELWNRQDFKDEAHTIAQALKERYFTQQDGFLFGEGPNIWTATKNGCYPVDLGYNVEESLPNLVYYARMVKDEELLKLVERSMSTHLEFMLPDGAWDNSWGTRSFKWTYWGGRTSDGFMGGYYAMAAQHPEYVTAIGRNISLLRQATHDGLLHGGMHYRESGMRPCIHHTFGHAKALASFLEVEANPSQSLRLAKLPREQAYGMKYFSDIRTWLIAEGDWRATLTGYDAEYKVKGTHPMGGAMSLLWHPKTGPIFAATMNRYFLIEAPNMQVCYNQYQMGGTPRVEKVCDGVTYSNLDDLNTEIAYQEENGRHCFRVATHLVDINQQAPLEKELPVVIHYEYSAKSVNMEIPVCPDSAYLVLPVIASPQEKVEVQGNEIRVQKQDALLTIACQSGVLSIAPTNPDGRIFNPVPGFAFVPVVVKPETGHKNIRVSLSVN